MSENKNVSIMAIKTLATRLYKDLVDLRQEILTLEHDHQRTLSQLPARSQDNARNLLHYLAVRRRDLRKLQAGLSTLGLSSLGRSEADVLATIDRVSEVLANLAKVDHLHGTTESDGSERLNQHATQLFGARRDGGPWIMVTLPAAAADNPKLVMKLLVAGMDVARINTGHDNPKIWQSLIIEVRKAARATKRSCRILLDLAGQKLRTGAMPLGPRVLHVHPQRDDRGIVLEPARVHIASASTATPAGCDGVIPVPAAMVRKALPGDVLSVIDCRGKPRLIAITARSGNGVRGECLHAAWIESGALVRLLRGRSVVASGKVGVISPEKQQMDLSEGDQIILTAQGIGAGPRRDRHGRATMPARIPCTLPEVFAHCRVGQRVMFDDGKFGGKIIEASSDMVRLILRQVPGGTAHLHADQGINLPDTKTQLPALTAEDKAILRSFAGSVDMLGISFVRGPDAVKDAHRALAKLRKRPGLVFKIETSEGFAELPRILLEALRSPPFGVIVARGDLAVEIGFERLAEVQEEILWLCEAARVPVVWGTQVLEKLVKKGLPTRAEVTDAAMSSRAECVMLNKGPYVVDAVRFLRDVVPRIRDHLTKKRAMLRRLRVCDLAKRDES